MGRKKRGANNNNNNNNNNNTNDNQTNKNNNNNKSDNPQPSSNQGTSLGAPPPPSPSQSAAAATKKTAQNKQKQQEKAGEKTAVVAEATTLGAPPLPPKDSPAQPNAEGTTSKSGRKRKNKKKSQGKGQGEKRGEGEGEEGEEGEGEGEGETVEIVTPGAAASASAQQKPKKGSNKGDPMKEFKFDFDSSSFAPPPPKGAVESKEDSAKDKKKKLNQALSKLSPAVRNRVHALRKLHESYTENEKSFDKELRELEEKYEKLNAPLFQKREKLVSGDLEPTKEDLLPSNQTSFSPNPSGPKGIPNFWLKVFQNSTLNDLVCPQDVEPFRHLVDVKASTAEKSFSLLFHFSKNAYFNTPLLKKTFYLEEDEDGSEMPSKYEATKIDWKPNKNLCVKLTKQQKKVKGRMKVITKEEPRESFFNFFQSSPSVDNPEFSEEDLDLMEELENDFELGKEIKEVIIPRALLWFTGELEPQLPQMMDGEFGDDDEDEDEDEDDDDDEDEDGDDEEDVGQVKLNNMINKKGDSAPVEQPPECKQQ